MDAAKLRALAADIEDVMLHNELDDADTETLTDVVSDMLAEADKIEPEPS